MGLSINKQKLINQESHTTIVTLSSSAIKEKKKPMWQQKRNREIITDSHELSDDFPFIDKYFCASLSSRHGRTAADNTVNELPFRCSSFETKVNPVQSNYNIGRANTCK